MMKAPLAILLCLAAFHAAAFTNIVTQPRDRLLTIYDKLNANFAASVDTNDLASVSNSLRTAQLNGTNSLNTALVTKITDATNSLNTSLRAALAQTNIFDGRAFTNIGTVGHPAANSSFVTNGATVWFTTNAAPGATALPNGSFATVTDGTFWVRTNSTWVRK